MEFSSKLLDSNYTYMVLFPLTNLIIAYASSLITRNNLNSWYRKLRKSKLTPPGWVFSSIWTVLHTMIGISGYLIWSKEKRFSYDYRREWTVYAVQLLLNTLWTPVFFSLRSIGGALIDIILLNFSIAVNIFVFYQRDKNAGLLLVPYLIWVVFAFYLNLMIWYWNVLQKGKDSENNNKDYNKRENEIKGE